MPARPGPRSSRVVKANAYGHGDVAVARTLVDAGVERLAVATVDEGLRLRDAGIAAPIVVLWGIGPAEASVVVEARLEPIVYDARSIELLEAAGAEQPIRVHLKVDTGPRAPGRRSGRCRRARRADCAQATDSSWPGR